MQRYTDDFQGGLRDGYYYLVIEDLGITSLECHATISGYSWNFNHSDGLEVLYSVYSSIVSFSVDRLYLIRHNWTIDWWWWVRANREIPVMVYGNFLGLRSDQEEKEKFPDKAALNGGEISAPQRTWKFSHHCLLWSVGIPSESANRAANDDDHGLCDCIIMIIWNYLLFRVQIDS